MEITTSSLIKFVSDGTTSPQTGDWLPILLFLLTAVFVVSAFLLKRNKAIRRLIGCCSVFMLCFGVFGIASADATAKSSDIIVHVNESTGELTCEDSQLTINSQEQLFLSTVQSNFDGNVTLDYDSNIIYNSAAGCQDWNLELKQDNTIKCSISGVDGKSLIGKDAGTITYTLRSKINPVAPATIYPAPKDIEYNPDSQFYLKNEVSVSVDEKIDQVTKDYFKAIENKNGILEANNKVNRIDLDVDENLTKYDEYKVDINKHEIKIAGKDTDAVYRGLQTFSNMLDQRQGNFIEGCSISDYAQAQWRGFIEGYYGIPWTNANRISLMEFGNQFKMNSYVFAPKDDPYHSAQWRDAYPEDQLAKMKELAQAGLRTKVDFTWAIHPFLHNAFDFNNYDADLKTITDKYEQLYSIGVRHFGISADDIGSAHPVSAQDQMKVLLDLDNWCKSKGDVKKLLFVPECYQKGRGGEPKFSEYWKVMKEAPQSIDMMWTGDNVMSWTTQDTFDYFKNVSNHDAYMWWNFPVNDYCKLHLLLGPAEMLVPDVNNFIGLVSNPMQQAQASKIALFSVANYTWDTKDFNRDKIWEASFKFVDNGAPEALKLLSNHMCASKYVQGMEKFRESEYMQADIDAATSAMKAGNKIPDDVSNRLKANYKEIKQAISDFTNKHANAGLYEEMQPWLKSFDLQCDASLEMLDVVATPSQEAYEHAKETFVKSTFCEVPKLESQVDKVYAEPGFKRLIPFINEMFTYYEKKDGVHKIYIDYDVDHDYYQYTLDNCTSEYYSERCAKIEAEGYSKYDTNNLNGNVSTTYTKAKDLKHIYFTPSNKQIRIILCKNTPAPPKEVAAYNEVCDETASIVKIPLGDSLCSIYRLVDGSFIILDSGVSDNEKGKHRSADELYKALQNLAIDKNNIHVRMWYFSHAHGDHVGGFIEMCDMMEQVPEYRNIHVDSFLYNFAGTQKSYQHVSENKSTCRNFEQHIQKYFPNAVIYKALTGQVYKLPGAKLEVVYSCSDFIPTIFGEELANDPLEWVREEEATEAAKGKGDGNLESACVKITSDKHNHSFLFTGDVGEFSISEMVRRYTGSDVLKSDLMTVPNHGWDVDRYRDRSGNKDFYNLVKPTAIFFPATVENFKNHSVADPTDEFSKKRGRVSFINTEYIVNICKDKCYVAGQDTYTLKMEDLSVL